VDGSFFTWKMLRFALGAMFFQSLFQSLISYRKKKEDDLGKYRQVWRRFDERRRNQKR